MMEPAGTPGRQRGRPRREPGATIHRKPCERINFDDAANWVRALHYAASDLGQEPNLHMVIQWRHAPSNRPIPERQQRLLNLIGQWVKRRTNRPAVWLYAREVGKLKGEHLHLCIYVPDKLRVPLEAQVRHWLEIEASPEAVAVSAVRADPIRPGDMRHTLKSYLLKEGDERVRATWVLERHRPTGGVVQGKRLKVSHSIGPAARKGAESALEGHFDVSPTQNHKDRKSRSGAIKSALEPIAAG